MSLVWYRSKGEEKGMLWEGQKRGRGKLDRGLNGTREGAGAWEGTVRQGPVRDISTAQGRD